MLVLRPCNRFRILKREQKRFTQISSYVILKVTILSMYCGFFSRLFIEENIKPRAKFRRIMCIR